MWIETRNQPAVFVFFFKKKYVKHQMWKAWLKWEKIKITTKIIYRIENEINSKVCPCSLLQEPFASEKLFDVSIIN